MLLNRPPLSLSLSDLWQDPAPTLTPPPPPPPPAEEVISAEELRDLSEAVASLKGGGRQLEEEVQELKEGREEYREVRADTLRPVHSHWLVCRMWRSWWRRVMRPRSSWRSPKPV